MHQKHMQASMYLLSHSAHLLESKNTLSVEGVPSPQVGGLLGAARHWASILGAGGQGRAPPLSLMLMMHVLVKGSATHSKNWRNIASRCLGRCGHAGSSRCSPGALLGSRTGCPQTRHTMGNGACVARSVSKQGPARPGGKARIRYDSMMQGRRHSRPPPLLKQGLQAAARLSEASQGACARSGAECCPILGSDQVPLNLSQGEVNQEELYQQGTRLSARHKMQHFSQNGYLSLSLALALPEMLNSLLPISLRPARESPFPSVFRTGT